MTTNNAILRIVFIAGATITIGAAIIAVAFLSSGSERSLLPPWQLIVAEASCVAILLLLSLNVLKFKKYSSVLTTAILISVILTIAVVAYFGVGHTWSLRGFAAKATAVFVMLAYPVLIPAVSIIFMRKRAALTISIWAVSMTFCLILTVPMIIVGLLLACVTGDCL